MSVISSMELIIGCRDKVELRKTLKFLAGYTTIEISTSISKRAYQLLVDYSKNHGLVIPDAFIAATALEEHLGLMTNNVRHFNLPVAFPGPPGTLPKAYNAGLVDIEWVIEDLTKSEVQQS